MGIFSWQKSKNKTSDLSAEKTSDNTFTFIYKCHYCRELLVADYRVAKSQTRCTKCNTSHIVPDRINTALGSLSNLEKSNIIPDQFPNIFYPVDLTTLKKLLKVFDIRVQNIDFFSYNSRQVQVPGTKTLFVVNDRSNTIPKEKGDLGKVYLDYHLFFVKCRDDQYYCFGDDKHGFTLEETQLYNCVRSAIHRLDAGLYKPDGGHVEWDESHS
ncbi:MAG: hypothetical protein HZC52_09915 [Planctomycetes bacterium]|nr:hypothetical protein [Planctomycetota bacterium]